MPRKIRITAGSVVVAGELNESRTAAAIWNSLPVEVFGSTWGQEVYFGIPVKHPPERSTTDVDAGDLAYWVQGECLCVFFGPTPMSVGERPVPASPVNRVGRLSGDFHELKRFRSGEKVLVEKYDEATMAETARDPVVPEMAAPSVASLAIPTAGPGAAPPPARSLETVPRPVPFAPVRTGVPPAPAPASVTPPAAPAALPGPAGPLPLAAPPRAAPPPRAVPPPAPPAPPPNPPSAPPPEKAEDPHGWTGSEGL